MMKTHVTALDRKSNILDAMVIASSVYLIIMSEPALSNLSLDPMRVMFHFCMETIK